MRFLITTEAYSAEREREREREAEKLVGEIHHKIERKSS